MIDPEDLKSIVSGVNSFQSTMYVEDPSILYAVGRPGLKALHNDLSFAHFVLIFPGLPKRANKLKLYKISQVGMYTPPNTCTYFQIPKYVVWDEISCKFWM